ncbi:unnamed protein product [Candidula unifasciata]|uniref:Folate receptor-like domain-containing protein n=1 Tax=Candidula unifasciata TaxID=100452 RepID=A0A8S3Z2Q0_9EUPU|nr:unnamed protein product [Candidula unifasciata]
MDLPIVLLLVVLQLTHVWSRLNNINTVDDYMNICLDGRNQKSAPGPEPDLMKKYCSPWASRSCCTPATAEGLSVSPRWLNFEWDHCQTLTPQCREYFRMDLCFYECSPNVGPWLVQDTRKIRKEKFTNVPLCQSVCNNWWHACKDDFTCLDNWAVGFNWSTGINTCPQGTTCRPFHTVYPDASTFCETVMGHSFQVVPDTTDCFVLWFDPSKPNPNEVIARKESFFNPGCAISAWKRLCAFAVFLLFLPFLYCFTIIV